MRWAILAQVRAQLILLGVRYPNVFKQQKPKSCSCCHHRLVADYRMIYCVIFFFFFSYFKPLYCSLGFLW